MAIFDNLLLAIDLSHDSDRLLSRVLKICQGDMEQVNVVHVLRSDFHDIPLRSESSDDPPLDIDQRRRRDQALLKLNTILRKNGFNVASHQIHIKAGEPATEIKRLAHDLEADLVIVGSHSKRGGGWLDLPGSTTNCVLQGIDADVMAVRV
ncbi:MAG: universal stress protein [Gammaproteobacteria bacterium]|nr:universal stress protein [Gammaproteobacteria bacterium]